jgi:hypothetical protein
MSADVEILDGAVPLVRNDQPWEWFVNFSDDEAGADPTDLAGKTTAAEIRWRGGSQAVTAAIYDAAAGQVRLSLTAAQTAAMPLGRLSKLYIALDADTEAVVPVDVIEGLFGVTEPTVADEPVNVLSPASGAIVVLTDFRPVYIDNAATLAALTFRLPIDATPVEGRNRVELSFRSPVTALSIEDGGGTAIADSPTNAYGPGSGLVMQYVDDTIGWAYWK